MSLFGKKTKWNHIPKEFMEKKEDKNSNGKLKIEITGNSFIDATQLATIVNDEPIESTIEGQAKDLVAPSIYILNSNDVIFSPSNLAIHGLMFKIASFRNKIVFCLEAYENKFSEFYDGSKSKFFPLLIIERDNIKDFYFEKNQKYKAVKNGNVLKSVFSSSPFIIGMTLLGGLLGGGIVGRLLGGGIGKSIYGLTAKKRGDLSDGNINDLLSKIDYDIKEKTGTIFHLKCNIENKEIEILIACETFYEDLFEKFLHDHWTVNKPAIKIK